MTVAALFVEKGGAYWGLDDAWCEERDARLYRGPWPVVAHPPCQRWCQLAPVVAAKLAHLGDKYAIGNDGGTFEAALRAVRTWGGVLEHPAYSLAWYRYGLPVPGYGGWTASMDDPGCATAVSQVAYGHSCRKRTWLYAVGCELPALDWSEPLHLVTGQVSSFSLHRRSFRERNLKRLDKNLSDPTPAAFRDVLLEMARSARPVDLVAA